MYSKTHWQDRVVDPETGEVVQEGTFMSAEHFNNMENGIEANDTAISEISESVETIETTLDKDVGTTIALTVNSSTFVMKLALKNSEGNILSESEVDLPIESMIVNAEYVEDTKSLVLTLQSGSKVTVPLSALINGLVNDTRKVAGMDLKKDITVAAMVTALGVDKKVNKTEVVATDETEISTRTVPAGCTAAMVAKIKGKTVKVGDELHSAPVESVVSVGKNIAKLFAQHTAVSGDGKISNDSGSSNYDTYIVRVRQGENYIIQSEDSAGKVYAFYSTYPSINSTVSYNGARTIAANGSITAPISGYLVFRTIHTRTSWANKGSTLLDYTPYYETTVLVPSAVKNLPDYGLGIVKSDGTIVANEVDFENGVYHHRVSAGTISSSGWWYSGSFFVITNYGRDVLKAKTSGQAAVITSKYNRDDTLSADKTIRLSNDINIKDTSYTDASKFAADLSTNPVTIVYELATVETIPLSDYIRPLPVESGGTLTLVNPHNLDVNSTIKYKKEV